MGRYWKRGMAKRSTRATQTPTVSTDTGEDASLASFRPERLRKQSGGVQRAKVGSAMRRPSVGKEEEQVPAAARGGDGTATEEEGVK